MSNEIQAITVPSASVPAEEKRFFIVWSTNSMAYFVCLSAAWLRNNANEIERWTRDHGSAERALLEYVRGRGPFDDGNAVTYQVCYLADQRPNGTVFELKFS